MDFSPKVLDILFFEAGSRTFEPAWPFVLHMSLEKCHIM